MSPLMYACREGRVKVISKLLDNQADINKQDSRGWTVSHHGDSFPEFIMHFVILRLYFSAVLLSAK